MYVFLHVILRHVKAMGGEIMGEAVLSCVLRRQDDHTLQNRKCGICEAVVESVFRILEAWCKKQEVMKED